MNKNCLKCREEKYILKSIVLPEKIKGKVNFDMNLYYLKICQNCGYTEMYNAKIFDQEETKDAIPTPEY